MDMGNCAVQIFVFWFVTPYSPVHGYRRFGKTSSPTSGKYYSGEDTFLRNVDITTYKALRFELVTPMKMSVVVLWVVAPSKEDYTASQPADCSPHFYRLEKRKYHICAPCSCSVHFNFTAPWICNLYSDSSELNILTLLL
jgi:hypothetical protein